MAELSGKVALVTGAASGIGEASARALAAAGAQVVVAALHEERAKVVSDAIVESGGEAIPVGFDTSDEAAVAEAIAKAVDAFGGIDILHNNAAITSVEFMMRDGMIHELDVDLWDQTMAVNVRGYMLCTKHVIPHMLGRGGGVVINTSSGAGMQGELVRAAYGTSKSAVIGFTRSVATQYGKLGIRSVTVMPGLTTTPTVATNMPPAIIEMMKRHTLTAELATPEDVANTVAFLASDGAAAITGSTIPVDGGFGIHGPSYADEAAMFAAMSGAAEAAQAERFRRALEARGRATLEDDDVALLAELFTPGTVWRGASADARGRDEIISRWNELAAQGNIEVGTVYADGTHVVGVLEVSGGDGAMVKQANVFHTNAEGQVTEVWSLPGNAAVTAGDGEHPNVAPFRAAEEARARNTFGSEDMVHIERFLRDDVQWHSAWGGGPSSRDEVMQQFEAFKQMSGGTMEMTLNDIFADDTHAVSLVRLKSGRPDRPGRIMDVAEANVFHLDPEGRAYEFWGVAEDQAAINAFWM